MDKVQKQRLEQLARQGIVPSSKLPMLMQAMSSLYMGKQLKPTERDVLAKYMHNMTDIMLKDTTVFNRAKLHTQKTKYQTEDNTVEIDENVRVVDGEEDMEVRGREKAERKAKRLSIRKRDKYRLLSPELKKEKKKAQMDEEVLELNSSYQEFFEATLEYFEVSNIRDLPEEKKADFFKIVDVALEEAKMAKKDHDGDGKIETSTAEYMGSRDKAIKKAMKPSWDSKQARANALNSLDKKAQAKQDMKKESFEDNEKRREKARADMAAGKYNKDGSLKDAPAKVKLRGFGPDGAKGNMGNPAARASLMKKEEAEQVNEYITSKQVKMAKGIANDPRHKGGDYTGAAEKMEKIKKGLSNHPAAKKALRQANEAVTIDMIRRAAERVKSGEVARDRAKRAEKAAKADMRAKGAQKGMAPTKKDVEEQVQELRKMIREGNEKIEAYKLLSKILNNKENLGE